MALYWTREAIADRDAIYDYIEADNPAALAHDPMLVKRLRRLRSSRQRARSARRFGVDV